MSVKQFISSALLLSLSFQSFTMDNPLSKPLEESLPKGRVGVGVNHTLAKKAVKENSPGNIVSLVTLKKDDTTTCLVGFGPYNDIEYEELHKVLFLPQLDAWSNQTTTTMLCSMLFGRPQLSERFMKACSDPNQLAAIIQEKYHIPLATVINHIIYCCDRAYGNLGFLYAPQGGECQVNSNPEHYFGEENLTRAVHFAKISPTQIDTNVLTIDGTTLGSKKKRKAFFAKNGLFERLKAAYLNMVTRAYNLTNYIHHLTKEQAYLEDLIQRDLNPTLTKKTQDAQARIAHKAQDLPAYFSRYASNWKTMSNLEFLLCVIKSKKQFLPSIQEFNKEVLSITIQVSDIHTLHTICSLQTSCKQNVILMEDIDETFCSFFEEAGFEVERQGAIRRSAIDISFLDDEVSFTLTYLQNFFAHLFGPPNEPAFRPGNPFELFMTQEELLPRTRLHRVKPVAQEKITYVDSTTGKISNSPFLDSTQIPCISCTMPFTTHTASMFFNANQAACSLACATKQVTKKCPKLTALLQKEELTPQEIRSLQQLAALCYLRYISLSPTSKSFDGLYAELNHPKLKEQLTRISAATDNPSWQQTLSLASECEIYVRQLLTYNEFFIRLKKDYYKALLSQAKKRRYDQLSLEVAPAFDEKDRLGLLQDKQFQSLIQRFNGKKSTPTLVFSGIYYELMNTIAQRVSFSPDALEPALSIEQADKPLEELLEWLGEKPEDKPQDPSFSVEHYAPKVIQEPIPKTTEEPPVELPTEEPTPTIGTATIPCLFAQQVPYTIKLFNARPLVPLESQTGRALWATHGPLKPSYRIKTIVALADSMKDTAEIIPTVYGSLMLNCTDQEYDISLREKLDLHHLFPPLVDQYLHKYGIPEQVDDLIQVSLPGTITYEDGVIEVGFFQVTFTIGSWVCIHRCFKRYTQQKSTYISPALEKALTTSLNHN